MVNRVLLLIKVVIDEHAHFLQLFVLLRARCIIGARNFLSF